MSRRIGLVLFVGLAFIGAALLPDSAGAQNAQIDPAVYGQLKYRYIGPEGNRRHGGRGAAGELPSGPAVGARHVVPLRRAAIVAGGNLEFHQFLGQIL